MKKPIIDGFVESSKRLKDKKCQIKDYNSYIPITDLCKPLLKTSYNNLNKITIKETLKTIGLVFLIITFLLFIAGFMFSYITHGDVVFCTTPTKRIITRYSPFNVGKALTCIRYNK